VPGKKRLAAAAAAAGACALLAACTPVKMGSAATAGSDRITATSLGNEVSNLQAAAVPYAGQVLSNGSPVVPATTQMPKDVLGWLIRFQIRDRVAQDAGVSVSKADINSELQALQQQYGDLTKLSVEIGLPPNLLNDLGRYEAQELNFIKSKNNNQIPTTQAGQNTALAQVAAADCKAANALNIQVNPQYGQLNFNPNGFGYEVIAMGDTLSRSGGTAPAVPTPTLPSSC
jgi:hypothetical protein